jgi:hypothetical protein
LKSLSIYRTTDACSDADLRLIIHNNFGK